MYRVECYIVFEDGSKATMSRLIECEYCAHIWAVTMAYGGWVALITEE